MSHNTNTYIVLYNKTIYVNKIKAGFIAPKVSNYKA